MRQSVDIQEREKLKKISSAQSSFTISSLAANLIAIPLAIFVIFTITFLYSFIWEGFSLSVALQSPFLKLPVFLPIFIILAILHEIIHWLSFRILGKVDSKHCRLGFQWKTITPYAHCSVPLKASVYRISLLLPVLILGIIPLLLALIFALTWLLIYGMIFTIVAGGDFLILWLIRKVPKDQLVLDHPSRCGCEVISS